MTRSHRMNKESSTWETRLVSGQCPIETIHSMTLSHTMNKSKNQDLIRFTN